MDVKNAFLYVIIMKGQAIGQRYPQVGIPAKTKKYPFLTQRKRRLLENLSSEIMHDLLGLSSFLGS